MFIKPKIQPAANLHTSSDNLAASTNSVEHVTTRSGAKERISYDKIRNRYMKLAGLTDNNRFNRFKPLKNIDIHYLFSQVIKVIYEGIPTSELDNIAAECASYECNNEPEYEEMSRRIAISNHNKTSTIQLTQFIRMTESVTYRKQDRIAYLAKFLYSNINDNGDQAPLIEPKTAAFMIVFSEQLENMMDYDADYQTKFSGFKLLAQKYMLQSAVYRPDGKLDKRLNRYHRAPVERIQDIWLRVAIYLTITDKYTEYNLNNDTEIYNALKTSGLLRGIPTNIIHVIETDIANGERVKWRKLTNYTFVDSEHLAAQIGDIIVANTKSWNDILSDYIQYWQSQDTNTIDWSHLEKTYKALSRYEIMHATPTLFNAGTLKGQMSSCYLLGYLSNDSIASITDHTKASATFGKNAGGLGSTITPIRSTNSYISGTGGKSNGLQPLIQSINAYSAYIDQGGGKRSGSHAIYIEPWHADIIAVLNMRLHVSENKPQFITMGMFINDEFMRVAMEEQEVLNTTGQRVQLWYLFDPDATDYLWSTYDEKAFYGKASDLTQEMITAGGYSFTKRYRRLVQNKRWRERVSALDIWDLIIQNLEQTGTPYVKFKDNVNRKNNQVHYGVVVSSNLCTEIDEVSTSKETAVCNLASICLPNHFLKFDTLASAQSYADTQRASYPELGENNCLLQVWTVTLMEGVRSYYVANVTSLISAVRLCIRNLDKIIDINYYPVKSAETSNLLHRPCGLGIQGMADLFNMLLQDYESGTELAFRLHELIYLVSLDTSAELSSVHGPYASYAGSPASKGKLQYDLWQEEGTGKLAFPLSPMADIVRENVKKYGLRNSLLTTIMPNASTATITGLNNSYEPYTGMYFTRKNNVGEYIIVNNNLVRTLRSIGLWNKKITNAIIMDKNSSISDIQEIPLHIRNAFKTAWEIPLSTMDKFILAISPFIDQSISYNIFQSKITTQLMKHYFYMWRNGAKTASYYCRSRAAIEAQKEVTVEKECIACQ